MRPAFYNYLNVRFVRAGIGLALMLASAALRAQSPPNDNFTNATVLTGSSISFTVTLTGATYEPAESSAPYSYYAAAGGSVWWTWTAPQSSTVVVLPGHDAPTTLFGTWLQVFSGTSITNPTLLGAILFDNVPGRYTSFQATVGTTYQIRVNGSWPNPFTLQLTATNPPIFIAQPQDTIVSPHGTAVFCAEATGSYQNPYRPPFAGGVAYQWQFNGSPLPGQRFPCLLINDATTNNAGLYSVIASNSAGTTLSSTAMLTFVDTNPIPRLSTLRPINNLSLPFTLTGEGGRWYKIESSADLQNWINPVWLQLTNSTTLVGVPRLGAATFARAALNNDTDVCVAQLQQMRWAVRLYTIENRKASTDTYSLGDLKTYLPLTPEGSIPTCPEHGYYFAGACVTNSPACSIPQHGHALPGQ